jgi:hypothetical protein
MKEETENTAFPRPGSPYPMGAPGCILPTYPGKREAIGYDIQEAHPVDPSRAHS